MLDNMIIRHELACLSVKRTTLIHWKERKLGCFGLENWLREYLDLTSIEQVIMTHQNGPWT